MITPLEENTSALVELRLRALNAYMGMKSKLSACFKDYVADTVNLFEYFFDTI